MTAKKKYIATLCPNIALHSNGDEITAALLFKSVTSVRNCNQ